MLNVYSLLNTDYLYAAVFDSLYLCNSYYSQSIVSGRWSYFFYGLWCSLAGSGGVRWHVGTTVLSVSCLANLKLNSDKDDDDDILMFCGQFVRNKDILKRIVIFNFDGKIIIAILGDKYCSKKRMQ